MAEGDLLWEPSKDDIASARITAYLEWLAERGKKFEDYDSLWRWSVSDLEGFWRSVWEYFGVRHSGRFSRALSSKRMPGAKWFEGTSLNYAEHMLGGKDGGPALIAVTEEGRREVSWHTLERETAALASWLEGNGVRRGDRVAAFVPNCPEAVVGMLATASIGAVWSSCSPDFGAPAVVDRFGQIKPKVLIAFERYRYGGKEFDRGTEVRSVARALPGLKKVITLEGGGFSTAWRDATSGRAKPRYRRVPFSDPLWILYSSGTTGLPKPIVHSQGGILLEHLKGVGLHNDVRRGDRLFWFTTTGWMMWNYVLGGLLHGSTVVLYDGSPVYPDAGAMWDLVDENEVTFAGVSAPYVAACAKSGLAPREGRSFRRLRGVGSTGSPLSPEGFEWLYAGVKRDLWVASMSGGTDVCTCFVGGCPTLPVYSGEIQCRWLGSSVMAYDEEGTSVVGETGELVVTEPMPSMPVRLWGDKGGSRYREAYFAAYPGVWTHGDWIKVTERGTCVIYGRSDSTIKRQGVRIGTADIYRTVESMKEVADSLAVEASDEGGRSYMVLFVQAAPGTVIGPKEVRRIQEKVRSDLSPRYVPDEVVPVTAVPRTMNGKKLEIPVKRLFSSGPANKGGFRKDDELFAEYARVVEELKRRWKL